jgi:hypothetical protein
MQKAYDMAGFDTTANPVWGRYLHISNGQIKDPSDHRLRLRLRES